jgi:threonine dehydratase
VTLTEDEIAATIRWLAGNHGITAEGAGACAAGAVLHKKLAVRAPCAVVISGGNIDDARFSAIVDL